MRYCDGGCRCCGIDGADTTEECGIDVGVGVGAGVGSEPKEATVFWRTSTFTAFMLTMSVISAYEIWGWEFKIVRAESAVVFFNCSKSSKSCSSGRLGPDIVGSTLQLAQTCSRRLSEIS